MVYREMNQKGVAWQRFFDLLGNMNKKQWEKLE